MVHVMYGGDMECLTDDVFPLHTKGALTWKFAEKASFNYIAAQAKQKRKHKAERAAILQTIFERIL